MASLVPASGDRLINRFTSGGPTGQPQLAALEGDLYIAAWQTGTDDGDILFQVFGIDGTPFGGESFANEQTNGEQDDPRLLVDRDGSVILYWESDNGGDDDIAYRRISSAGLVVGGEGALADDEESNYVVPDTGLLSIPAGGYFLLFSSNFSSRLESHALRLNENLEKIDEINFGSFGIGPDNSTRDTVLLGNGNIVVALDNGLPDADGDGFIEAGDQYGRIVDPRRFEPIRDEFLIPGTVAGGQNNTRLAATNDGGFIAVYQSEFIDGDGWGIGGRRFSENGDPQTFEFVVNETTVGDQVGPEILQVAPDTYLVAWRGDTPGGTTDIYGRLIDADGRPLSDEIVLSENTAGGQGQIDLADFSNLGPGLVGVAWRSNTPESPDDYDVYSRIFRVATGDQIILDAEGVQTVALVYEAGLNRDGNIDLPGLNFWIDQRETGLTEKQLARAFLNSTEFELQFGDPDELSNREIIEVLYQNILNRPGEERGVNFWLGELDRPGFDRADLLLRFAESAENRAGSTFVEDLAGVSPGTWDFAG